MTNLGLQEVSNPSTLFLGERSTASPGSSVFAGVEGSRPILIEIQALVAPSPFGTPRRSVLGWDQTRLSMILAVLEARCGVRFGQHDVFLNIAGGIKISEPGADLAVAAALISSMTGIALPTDYVYFGEVSLSGAIRPVSQSTLRLKEAKKLGFTNCCCPVINEKDETVDEINLLGLEQLGELVSRIASKAHTNINVIETNDV